MYKFKVGDKIRCGNKIGNLTSCLVIGKQYTVRALNSDGSIELNEIHPDGNWSTYQFVLEKAHKKKIKPFGIVTFCKKYYK